MTSSRRRVAFRPALEGLSARITPSDLIPCTPMPTSTLSMPISTDSQTYTPDTVPPLYPPYGTPGTTAADYV